MVNYSESPGLLEYMFKMFSSDKVVEISKESHLPIILLHKKFSLPASSAAMTTTQWLLSSSDSRIKPVRDTFQKAFWTLLYFCYTQNFKPLLQTDMEQVETFLSLTQLHESQQRQVKIGYTNDIGWGCTLRVA